MRGVSFLKGILAALPERDDLEARVAEEPVFYIPSPEGTLGEYEGSPAQTARVVDEAANKGVFNDALAGLTEIDA
jgi:hypothetical protein